MWDQARSHDRVPENRDLVWEKGDKDERYMGSCLNVLSWTWIRHINISSWCISPLKNVHKCCSSIHLNEHTDIQITKHHFPLEAITAPWRKDWFQIWSDKHTSQTLSILSYQKVETLIQTLRVMSRGLDSPPQQAPTCQRWDELSFDKNTNGFK